jgi:poly-gamma-glutamate synthesis protein (capsule biosynthesis protein)
MIKKDSVKIIAVGDIFLGEHPVTLNHGVNSVVEKKGSDFIFSEVKGYLNRGDIICGNLEGIISPKREGETGIRSAIFWGNPSCASALSSAGFNCLFLANNHTAQHGEDALRRTCQLLDEHHIKWTGVNPGNPNSSIPAIFQVRNLNVALLSYCDTQQYHMDDPLLSLAHFENIKKDVERAQGVADIIIVSLHWGDEFIDYPAPSQREMAHKIIDLGVHFLVGHHSHTMQGVERYKQGVIAYSLGSFVKDLWSPKFRESVILECEVSPKGVVDLKMVPIYINDQWQPELYGGETGRKFLNRMEALSRDLEQSNPTDLTRLEEKYKQELKRLLLQDRIETIVHYFFNLFRYDKRLLLENIVLMLKRRMHRKNI